ncbi:unnamed protein product [Orchesella dallaii]|uniref:C2H2-type domain-containing protein n=1 Tax=Orchesella dallaii TaxID=48710 RepID=A0ABP1RHE9_9HEXA
MLARWKRFRTPAPGEGLVLKSICMFPSCIAKFGTPAELQLHVQKNHASVEDSKFMCILCGKVFVNQARLTRHNLVHSKEKRYECHVCKKRFPYNASLKEHLQAVHDLGKEQQYFKCEQPNCESKFKVRKYVQRHMKDVHGLNMNVVNLKVTEKQ